MKRRANFLRRALLALAAVGLQIPSSEVSAQRADEAIRGALLPMLVLGFCATFIAASSIAQTRRTVEERKLLLGALKQAPDYLFVKDRESHFVAVNEAVATLNGKASADDMRGLTDFDIASAARAQRLFDRFLERSNATSSKPT